MPSPELTFFFDYSSPFAYLGACQVEAVAAEHQAELKWFPFLLGGLFRAIGTPNVPLFSMPEAKQRHARADMDRWAEHHGVPLRFPTRFPMNTVSALRMTLQLPQEQRGKLALPLFRAYWAEDRDINDADELRTIATDAGFDGEALLAGCAQAEVKLALREHTETAEQQGVCGAPCFLVRHQPSDEGMLFWGQDRLAFVAKALTGWKPACG